jgi:hypothetical protein
MDERYIAQGRNPWWEKLDEKRMTADVWVSPEEDSEEELITTEIEYVVCPLCEGKGSHVHPDIDSHGIGAEEFYDDPDFAEDYYKGTYDVPCYQCKGRRVVPVPLDPVVVAYLKRRDEEEYQYQLAVEAERRMGA